MLRRFITGPNFFPSTQKLLKNGSVPKGLVKIQNPDKYLYLYSKIQQTKMLVRCQRFVDLFYLDWSGSKSWLLTCSNDITLSLPSYTGSDLKRELNFCNGYLSLLYFCLYLSYSALCSDGFLDLKTTKEVEKKSMLSGIA